MSLNHKHNTSMGNRLVHAKQVQLEHSTHRQRLRSIKPVIDLSGGISVEINRNKQFEREDYVNTIIEKENRLLLSRITGIAKNHKSLCCSTTPTTNVITSVNRGNADNEGNHHKRHPSIAAGAAVIANATTSSSPTAAKKYQVFYPAKSLNATTRKQALSRIQHENIQFLKRINEQKSSYDLHQQLSQFTHNSFQQSMQGHPKQQHSRSISNSRPSTVGATTVTTGQCKMGLTSKRHSMQLNHTQPSRSVERDSQDLELMTAQSGGRPRNLAIRSAQGSTRNSLSISTNDLYGQRISMNTSPNASSSGANRGSDQCWPAKKNPSKKNSPSPKSKKKRSPSRDEKNKLKKQKKNSSVLKQRGTVSQNGHIYSMDEEKSSNSGQYLQQQQQLPRNEGGSDNQGEYGALKVIEVLMDKENRSINGVQFNLEILLTANAMVILAEEIHGDDMKIIEIPRGRAIEFLQGECENHIENLLDRLLLQNGQLFLVSKSAQQQQQSNPNNFN